MTPTCPLSAPDLLLCSERQFVTSRNALNYYVLLLDTLLLELVDRPADKSVNNGRIPSGVNDEYSVARSIVGFGWGRQSFDSSVGHLDV